MFPLSAVPARRRALAFLPLLIACTGHTPAALAQDDTSLTVPPIVVTPTRLPTPESEVASSVTVITAADIARHQYRTFVDILNAVPGLNVVQTGGAGETASVYMRGTDANQVKVLLDGIDIGDPSQPSGAFDASGIVTADIDRVEVLRGPQSGLYGADAVGGVINIITKRGEGPPKVTGSIEGGSYGTFNQAVGASGSLSRFSYAFDITHYHDNTPVTPSSLVPVGRNISNDTYDNTTLSTRLGAQLTPTIDVGVVGRYTDSLLDFTQDDLLGPETQLSQDTQQELFTRGTLHQKLLDGLFDQTFGIGYTDYRRRYFDPNAATVAGGNDPSDYHGNRIKFDWQGNLHLYQGETLTLGAEHQTDSLADSTPTTAAVDNDAGYIQLASQLGHLYNTLSLRYDDNSQFGGKATYRIAPAYLIPATGTKLKASLGTGFNPPTLDELYESYPAFDFYANPHLQPETSLGYDAGFEQTLWQGKASFGATYFHNDIRNLITDNAAYTSDINIGRATTYGVESFVAVKPLTALTLRADYTYTSAEDDILHEALLRRPKNKVSVDGTYRVTPQLSLTATVLYVGAWVDDNRDVTETNIGADGYTLVNLAGSYDLGRGFTAFARINNLLDRHYQDPLGFDHPGLAVIAGVKVAFDAGTFRH